MEGKGSSDGGDEGISTEEERMCSARAQCENRDGQLGKLKFHLQSILRASSVLEYLILISIAAASHLHHHCHLHASPPAPHPPSRHAS